jgi:hypothetical protein
VNPENKQTSRVDALRKLLEMGELYRCEIDLVMGGDKGEISQALADLMAKNEVIVANDSFNQKVYRMYDSPPHLAR